MAVTATKSTECAAQASPVAEVVAPEPDAVEYPDRPWIAQSVRHGDAVGLAKAALQHHFRDRDDVLVAMELVVYYVRGDNRAWLRPDVLVASGVGRGRERGTFKGGAKARHRTLSWRWPRRRRRRMMRGTRRGSTLRSECADTGGSTRPGS